MHPATVGRTPIVPDSSGHWLDAQPTLSTDSATSPQQHTAQHTYSAMRQLRRNFPVVENKKTGQTIHRQRRKSRKDTLSSRKTASHHVVKTTCEWSFIQKGNASPFPTAAVHVVPRTGRVKKRVRHSSLKLNTLNQILRSATHFDFSLSPSDDFILRTR